MALVVQPVLHVKLPAALAGGGRLAAHATGVGSAEGVCPMQLAACGVLHSSAAQK